MKVSIILWNFWTFWAWRTGIQEKFLFFSIERGNFSWFFRKGRAFLFSSLTNHLCAVLVYRKSKIVPVCRSLRPGSYFVASCRTTHEISCWLAMMSLLTNHDATMPCRVLSRDKTRRSMNGPKAINIRVEAIFDRFSSYLLFCLGRRVIEESGERSPPPWGFGRRNSPHWISKSYKIIRVPSFLIIKCIKNVQILEKSRASRAFHELFSFFFMFQAL